MLVGPFHDNWNDSKDYQRTLKLTLNQNILCGARHYSTIKMLFSKFYSQNTNATIVYFSTKTSQIAVTRDMDRMWYKRISLISLTTAKSKGRVFKHTFKEKNCKRSAIQNGYQANWPLLMF